MAGYTETERLEVLEFLDEEGLLESYDNPILRVEFKELIESLSPTDRKVMILKYFLLAHLKFLLQWR